MSEEMTTTGQELTSIKAEVYQQPLNAFVPQVTKGTDILNAIEKIEDPAGAENALALLNKGKALSSAITKKVDEICRPLKDMKLEIDEVQRKIKDYADEIKNPIFIATKTLEGKIIWYQKRVKEEADRIRKVNDEMIAEARQKAIEEARKNDKPEPEPQEPVVVETIPVVETPKIKGVTTIWKYEVTNADEVPREYLTPDTTKINAAVKGGCREIPGVRIYEDQFIRKFN